MWTDEPPVCWPYAFAAVAILTGVLRVIVIGMPRQFSADQHTRYLL